VNKPAKVRRKEPELFLNRELSWLEFNARVLEEAMDAATPMLERLKFALIVASNLDEFFVVRVAALQNDVEEGDNAPDFAGLTPTEQLRAISARAHELVDRLHRTVREDLLPALAARGIRLTAVADLDPTQRAVLGRSFRDDVLPALTPLAIDSSRPFPMLASFSMNIAVLLAPAEGQDQPRLAVVQVPSNFPHLVRPAGLDGSSYVLLSDVARSELALLFPGQSVLEAAAFRVARDAELDLDDEGGSDNFMQELEEELRRRRQSRVVRLEIGHDVSDTLLQLLTSRLGVAAQDVYRIFGPALDLRALSPLLDLPALEDLRDAVWKPLVNLEPAERADLFATLEQRDVLLHHPYEAFDPVVEMLEQAARDPDVLAIKQTLYRTSGDSPIVRALATAAEQGKQVTVLIELTARFDEQSNIRWARNLEQAGAHVIYGVRGYKTHAKMCMVVRRTRAGIRRYVHLGTGNYNDRTARVYTDMSLLTSNRDVGNDASAFFNALTGYSDPPQMKTLTMAPGGLRERFVKLIERERLRAQAGQPAEIRAKMNSLVDEDIIRALYEASRAGVSIKLNVRGVCCLRPSVKGLSETIEVVSIVDRFLEHTRAFHFKNGGDEEVYLSSADWMPRNFDRRVELLFPVQAPECRKKVIDALDAMFLDTVKARRLQSDGGYKRKRPAKGEEPLRAQLYLYRETQRAFERVRAVAPVTLEPLTSPRS
jgi:polyphosphate kinase